MSGTVAERGPPRQGTGGRTGGQERRNGPFEGVALGDVLVKHGVALGKALRGPALAHYVVVKAADGYRAVYALPELDSSFNDRVILLADRRNGAPLDAVAGPFRIVVPGEKHEARWVRQVTEIDVEAAP